MKQIYQWALFLGILPGILPGQYSQSFDSDAMPSGWRVINGRGTETWKTWRSYDSTFSTAHSGSHFLGLEYGSSANNSFIVSPVIVIKEGISDKLTFWAKNRGAGLAEQLDVKISVTAPTEKAFAETLVTTLKPTTSWAPYTYDLTSYIGQKVYISFYSTGDNWFVGIDDFQVSGNVAGGSETSVKSVYLYPNPVKDFLHLENMPEISEVTVYNVSGTLVKKVKSNNEMLKIDMKDLAAGIYIIKIKSGNIEKSYRIIKK